MKTIKMKTLAAGIVATMILFTGCKKTAPEKGDKGDAGPAGVVLSSDGYIKGTITGTDQNNNPFSVTYNFTNYFAGAAGTLDSISPSTYSFNLARQSDLFGDNSASISFTSSTVGTSMTGTFDLSNFSFTKSTGTRKEFVFKQTGSSTSAQTFSYTSSTGIFTNGSGSITLTIPGTQNSTGHTAYIVLQFQSTMTRLYYLKKRNLPQTHVVQSNG